MSGKKSEPGDRRPAVSTYRDRFLTAHLEAARSGAYLYYPGHIARHFSAEVTEAGLELHLRCPGARGLTLPYDAGGYLPTGGLFLSDHFVTERRRLLEAGAAARCVDIGTGPRALMANVLAALGAGEVHAVEVEERSHREACAHARYGVRVHHAEGCRWLESWPPRSFDLIVSNPPILPLPEGATPSFYDHSGEDGLQLTRSILERAAPRLRPGGAIVLLCFDFLLATSRDGRSLALLAEGLGLTLSVAQEVELEANEKILRVSDWVGTVFPDYRFRKRDGTTLYGPCIVEYRPKEPLADPGAPSQHGRPLPEPEIR